MFKIINLNVTHLSIIHSEIHTVLDHESPPIDPGTVEEFIDKGQECHHVLFDHLRRNHQEPVRHTIKKDGSCWCRALWQCIFSQIFSNDQIFDAFIQKIIDAPAHEIPESLANPTISILKN